MVSTHVECFSSGVYPASSSCFLMADWSSCSSLPGMISRSATRFSRTLTILLSSSVRWIKKSMEFDCDDMVVVELEILRS